METTKNTNASAEDRAAIQQVMESERLFRDTRQWERQLACFTEDATVTAGWFQGTAKEFVEKSQAQTHIPNILLNFHYLIPSSISVYEDRAVVHNLTEVIVRFEVDGVELDLNSTGRGLTRVRRTTEGWKIVELVGVYLKDSVAPALPWQKVPIKPEELEGVRPSYRMMIWMMRKLGYSPSQEMAGADRPEQVAALYAHAEDWLLNGK